MLIYRSLFLRHIYLGSVLSLWTFIAQNWWNSTNSIRSNSFTCHQLTSLKPLGVNLEEQELLGEKASKVVNGGAPLDYSDCRSDWDNISPSDSLKELWLVSGLWSCACPIWLLLTKIWKYSNLYIVINCPVICIKIAVDILLKQDHSFNEAPELLADVILT